MTSSRNAFRHGLSCPLSLGPDSAAKIEGIALVVAGNGAGQEQLVAAVEFAHAQLEVLRIRAKRAELIAKIVYNTQELRRLAALDRYERYALTERRRAAGKF